MVPTGLGANCTGTRPIVLYAHGTTTDHAFNMVNLQNAETLFLASLFASHGYIVVAPNYAGYDTSTLPYHPYLIADQESKDRIDALTAARTALPFASAALTKDSGQLFITGYSHGDGNPPRHAGCRNESHRIGSDVEPVCPCRFCRRRFLR